MKNLKITLPNNWMDISDENDNSSTYINNEIEESGVLQLSFTEYVSGEIPNPSKENLVNLSNSLALSNDCKITKNESGECEYGTYGYVEAKSEKIPFISIWHISDSKNFILATYIFSGKPIISEIEITYNLLKGIRKK